MLVLIDHELATRRYLVDGGLVLVCFVIMLLPVKNMLMIISVMLCHNE